MLETLYEAAAIFPAFGAADVAAAIQRIIEEERLSNDSRPSFEGVDMDSYAMALSLYSINLHYNREMLICTS